MGMRGVAIIVILAVFFNFLSIEARGEEGNLKNVVTVREVNAITEYRGDVLEVREVLSDQRDIDTGLREVFFESREILQVFRDENTSLNFINPLRRLIVTSNWGKRIDPLNGKTDSFHKGIDLAASLGTRVYCPESGVVRTVGWLKGYGKTIIIDHGDGYSTWYAHLSTYKVKKGDLVGQGDFIARTGNTGRSTGPHLHYEVRYKEESVNPEKFLHF